MLVSILFILFAWFIEMPLWLSIMTTCVGALALIVDFVKIGMKLQKEQHENDDDKEDDESKGD